MILMVCALALGILAIFLLVTAEVWLVGFLNVLDRCLAAVGFGTWSAGMLTRAEKWVRERKDEKGQ